MSEPSADTGQQAINEWLDKAFRVVKAVHPSIDFGADTVQTRDAQQAFEFCLYEHFCVPDSYMDLEGVRLAWRDFYTACIVF